MIINAEPEPEPSIELNPRFKMKTGSFYIPKPNPLKPLGDDSHFFSSHPEAIGVADGVGGWDKRGIDAGEYARKLINISHAIILSQLQPVIIPKTVITEAYSNTELKGSATACIITLDQNHINAFNIGDSGFVLIRGGKVVYKSPVQLHGFNCPYQLGDSKDTPDSGVEIRVKVECGDVIVAGTDGLFDNLFDSEIEELIKVGVLKREKPEILARRIAFHARSKSMCKSCSSPFADASAMAGRNHKGGKPDDITVVVGHIVPSTLHVKFFYRDFCRNPLV